MIDEARIFRLIASDIVNDEYVTAEDFDSTFLAYNETEKLEISYFLSEKGIKIRRSYSLANEISPNSRQEDATVVVTKNQLPSFDQEKVQRQKKNYCKLRNVIPQKFVNNLNNKKSAALTNVQLSALIFKGDTEAELEILIKNQNLVIREATRLNQLFGNSLEIEDLIQSGYIGLLNVVRKKPLDSNTNCSQLFVRHIRKSILVEIASGGYFISFPYENVKRYFKISQIYKNNKHLDYASLLCCIKEKLNLNQVDFKDMLSLRRTIFSSVSLNSVVDKLYDTEIQDVIRLNCCDMEDVILHRILLDDIKNASFGTLSPRYKQILILRMGFGVEDPWTLDRIGQKMNLTRERVRQIVSLSITKSRRVVLKNIISE